MKKAGGEIHKIIDFATIYENNRTLGKFGS